jgi:hypothetical protein
MRIQAWNLVFLIGVIVYVCIRGVFGGRTKRNQKVLSRVDTCDRTLLALVVVGTSFCRRCICLHPGSGSQITVCPRSFHGAGP